MSTSPLWQARDGLELISLDGEIAVFDPGRGRTVLLNQTASDVFSLLDGRTTVDDVVAILARAYGVAPERLAADVDDAVSMLHGSHVIARTGESSHDG